MTSKWDYVVCFIEESKDVSLMSIQELQSSLILHEPKVIQPNNVDEQTTLKEYTESSSLRI